MKCSLEVTLSASTLWKQLRVQKKMRRLKNEAEHLLLDLNETARRRLWRSLHRTELRNTWSSTRENQLDVRLCLLASIVR